MTFQGLKAVEEFYKSYAHHSGFGVRIGQQKKLENEIVRTNSCNVQAHRTHSRAQCVQVLQAYITQGQGKFRYVVVVALQGATGYTHCQHKYAVGHCH